MPHDEECCNQRVAKLEGELSHLRKILARTLLVVGTTRCQTFEQLPDAVKELKQRAAAGVVFTPPWDKTQQPEKPAGPEQTNG